MSNGQRASRNHNASSWLTDQPTGSWAAGCDRSAAQQPKRFTSQRAFNIGRRALVICLLLLHAVAAGTMTARTTAAEIPIGVAKVDITPDHPVRLSGYASRKTEAAEVANRIWAKALVFGGDSGQGPAVLLTVENCGVTKPVVDKLFDRLQDTGLRRERLVVSSSHSHTAPWLLDFAPFLFHTELPDDHRRHLQRYESRLLDDMAKVVRTALANRQPARLYWTQGTVRFAVNRRALQNGRWSGFGVQADGPVDHRLPLLVAKDATGRPIAVWANYACHCTTLGGNFNQISGDWLGFAQQYLDDELTGCTALISIGCGADANPNPRGELEKAKQHGRVLADEVKRLLAAEMKPVEAPPTCKLMHIDLPFAPLPSEEYWQKTAAADGARGFHAKHFLDRLQRGEKLPTSVRYPVGTWTFGDDLAMVFLGGEVVVDYAMRMQEEFDGSRLWITAYANDVPCYIPSKRVLREGGYEADSSMIYYGQPTRFSPAIEDLIIDAVQKLLPAEFYSAEKQADFPPPTPVEAAVATFRLREGMQIELVAAEPLVVDPVAFDWGPDGRLWVVEMRDYPNGLGWNSDADTMGIPGGRINVLEDTDSDGRYDRAQLFMDDISFPTGIKVWRQGVLVTAAPDIFYAEDTDGDGVADVKETLYAGFGEGNQQHRVNGLRWGLDNWLYVGNGDSDGKIRSLKTGVVVNVSGRDLRIRPDEGLLDAQSGRTQFGRSRDDWGNWFGGNNSNPMWHYVLADHYLRRNPHFAPLQIRHDVSEQPGAAPVFPVSRTLTRFNDLDRANRFTSACSPMIYRDQLLGDEFVGNSLVCEPVHNLVHREIVRETGLTFSSKRAEDEQDAEFLASTDNWFRPSMVRTGPDGAIWISDMYRFVIEHPKWIPDDWQRKLDLRAGETRGRIYRIFATDRPPRTNPQLDRLDSTSLVQALDSPNGWQRDMVQQMLVWRQDPTAVEPLRVMAVSAARPLARLHALCTLDGLAALDKPALDKSTLMKSLSDENPGIRRHAIRLCEGRFADFAEIKNDFARLARDPSQPVRLQLAYTLGSWSDPAAAALLAELAWTSSADPFFEAAVMSSLTSENTPEVLLKLVERLAAAERPPAHVDDLLGRLIGIALSMDQRDSVMESVVEAIFRDTAPRSLTLAVLAHVGEALSGRGKSLPGRWKQQLAEAVDLARATAADPSQRLRDRIHAVEIAGWSPSGNEDDLNFLGRLLRPVEHPDLQAAAIKSLGRIGSPQAAQVLLTDWSSRTPRLRAAALDQLLSKPVATNVLLTKLEAGEIALADIDAGRRRQLVESQNAEIRTRAAAIFGDGGNDDRDRIVEQHKDVLTMKPDIAAGQQAFKAKCSTCHRLGEIGHPVGPDLASLTDKSPAALLTAILNPNRAVEDKYRDYVCITEDGRVLNGILSSETSNSIVLTGQNGKQTVVLRNQIAELRATGKSLMPDGLEKDLSRQTIADVIAFVRETTQPPKPFPGNVPQTVRADSDGAFQLRASHAKIYGPRIVFETKYENLGWWAREQDRAVWTLDVGHGGRYDVILDYACHTDAAGDRFALIVGDQQLSGQVAATGTWDDYRQVRVGHIELKPGMCEVIMRSDGRIRSALLDLRTIILTPAK